MIPSASAPAATWSDDRVTALSALWLEGLSASQIAKQLGGVTRNAVIGKVHRLCLAGRAAPSAPTRAARVSAPRPRRVARAARPATSSRQLPVRVGTAPPVVVAPEGPGLVDNLVLLGVHACKWPIGDPKTADFSFCGRQAAGRYCQSHEQQGVRPARNGGPSGTR
jgi:GcrA cell cycle regulator